MVARRDVGRQKEEKNQNDDGVDKAEKERLLGSQKHEVKAREVRNKRV